MAIRTDYDNNKHHLRHHVIPEKNEGLDIGLDGQRFRKGRFAEVITDTITAASLIISSAVTITTSLTLSFLGVGVVKSSSAGVISAGTVNLASTDEVSGDLPLSNIVQGTALSVLGVTGNSAADHADIVAASDGQVFRRSGTAVAFGAVDLDSANSVTGTLAVANGGTNSASAADARTALGVPSLDASYVVIGASTELTADRVLTAGIGISLTDAGANSTVTVNATFSNPIVYQVFGG